MRYKLTQAAGHVQPLAARCISKWAIAALVTTDSLAQLYTVRRWFECMKLYRFESCHRQVDKYILFSDPQFSVLNQIPETLEFNWC